MSSILVSIAPMRSEMVARAAIAVAIASMPGAVGWAVAGAAASTGASCGCMMYVSYTAAPLLPMRLV